MADHRDIPIAPDFKVIADFTPRIPEMIKRVAQDQYEFYRETTLKLYEASVAGIYTMIDMPLPWDKLHHDQKADCYEAARIAIAAMREPTEMMTWRGEEGAGGETTPDMAASAWRAMIDAALKE